MSSDVTLFPFILPCVDGNILRESMKREYEFMHKDVPVASVIVDSGSGAITDVHRIHSLSHLPPRAARSSADFIQWWRDRAIPETRTDLRSFLDELGIRSTGCYLIDNLGLSLSDAYWMKPEGSELSWKMVNLFDNTFSDGSVSGGHADSDYSPDASTGGDLPKRWIIESGRRYLVKGNAGGTSQQSRNEVLATIIHRSQNFKNFVSYELVSLPDNSTGCRCAAFTDSLHEFISAWDLVGRAGYASDVSFRSMFIESCVNGGLAEDDVIAQLDYMAVTDFIISNSDRHLNNFGILRNPDTLEFTGLAPIFDSGNSMMYRNPAGITLVASIFEKTHGFYKSYRTFLEHVKDIHSVDISEMPAEEDVQALYSGDLLLSPVADKLGRLYSDRLSIVSDLQDGMSYYESLKKHGVR